MYKLVISLTYLKGRLITMCSILFVATGMMTLIVVNSVMGGFQKEFKARLRGTLSHMTVTLLQPEDYDHYAQLLRDTPHVTDVAPRMEGLVLLAHGGRVQGCKVLGVDPALERRVGSFDSYLVTPYRELRQQMMDVAESPRFRVEWDLDGIDRDSHGRLRAYFVERVRAKQPGADDPMPNVVLRRQAVVFDGERVTHREIKVSGVPAEVSRSGTEFDRVRAWFAAFNRELAAADVEGALQRFSPDLTVNVRFLDPAQPFLLAGGRAVQDEPGVLIGSELMRVLGLRIGDRVELVTARLEDKPGQPRDPARPPTEQDLVKIGRLFVVTGAFKTGMNEYDSNFLYAPYDEMIRFLDRSQNVSIGVHLDDFNHATAVRAAIEPQLKVGMYVETWQDKRRNLIKAVDMERGVMFVIMFFFILFAVVTIAVILILLVVEKYRDIGILKSMGASSWGIASIFVTNGLVAGAIGCALGVAAGVYVAYHVNEIADVVFRWTGYKIFPRDVYYLDRIPSDVDPSWIATTVVASLVLCLLCCLAPAIKAGRLQVVDTLKWE